MTWAVVRRRTKILNLGPPQRTTSLRKAPANSWRSWPFCETAGPSSQPWPTTRSRAHGEPRVAPPKLVTGTGPAPAAPEADRGPPQPRTGGFAPPPPPPRLEVTFRERNSTSPARDPARLEERGGRDRLPGPSAGPGPPPSRPSPPPSPFPVTRPLGRSPSGRRSPTHLTSARSAGHNVPPRPQAAPVWGGRRDRGPLSSAPAAERAPAARPRGLPPPGTKPRAATPAVPRGRPSLPRSPTAARRPGRAGRLGWRTGASEPPSPRRRAPLCFFISYGPSRRVETSGASIKAVRRRRRRREAGKRRVAPLPALGRAAPPRSPWGGRAPRDGPDPPPLRPPGGGWRLA